MNDSPQCSIAGGGYGSGGGGGGGGRGSSGSPLIPVYVSDHACDKPDKCQDFRDVDEDCVNRELEIGKKLGYFAPPFNSCQSFVWDVVSKCTKGNANKPYFGHPNLR